MPASQLYSQAAQSSSPSPGLSWPAAAAGPPLTLIFQARQRRSHQTTASSAPPCASDLSTAAAPAPAASNPSGCYSHHTHDSRHPPVPSIPTAATPQPTQQTDRLLRTCTHSGCSQQGVTCYVPLCRCCRQQCEETDPSVARNMLSHQVWATTTDS